MTLRPGTDRSTAPAEVGAYTRDAARWLERDFLALRPSLEIPEAIFAYCVEIRWDVAQACLVFAETGRLDDAHAQQGVVSLPSGGQIYLHTNSQGQLRTAILNRPQRQGEMFGLMLTLAAGPALRPSAFPFVLVPLPADAQVGLVRPGDERFAAYGGLLKIATDSYVSLVAPPSSR